MPRREDPEAEAQAREAAAARFIRRARRAARAHAGDLYEAAAAVVRADSRPAERLARLRQLVTRIEDDVV